MTTSLRRLARAVAVLLVCLLLVGEARSEEGATPEPPDGLSYNERVQAFKKALKSKDPKARARAFDYLRQASNPKIVTEITKGLRTVEREETTIHKAMEALEAGYEKSFSDLEDAKQTFEMSQRSGRDMERYNKRARKISKDLDAAVFRLKTLENDFTRNRAMLQQGVIVMGEILGRLEGEALGEAVALLTQQWLQHKEPHWRVRWVHALAERDDPLVTEALRGVVTSEAYDDALRAIALDALVAREDGWVLGHALDLIQLPPEKTQLVRAGIAALRGMHDKRGIAPLIAFLEREDLKAERNLAWKALTSLTGLDHGPYAVMWKKWWSEQKQYFVMPKDPKPKGQVVKPKKGTTFYGIQTFSDRILYIVDISGSMDRPQKGEGEGGKSKMAVCKQELVGSVFNLNPTDTFNVIFFNHQVIPWQNRKVEATDRNKKLLKAWVEDQQPLGATNIYDSLEMGFKIAHRVTGPPALDTIFFLTDGKPTAGKVRDLERILDVVREWNKTAKMTIHCIGIGQDTDAEFLKELARIGDGQFQQR